MVRRLCANQTVNRVREGHDSAVAETRSDSLIYAQFGACSREGQLKWKRLGSASESRSGKRTRPVFNRWKRPCSVPFVASARKESVPFETVTSADLCEIQNLRRVLHAIDATPARWRGAAGPSPLDGASAAASSP